MTDNSKYTKHYRIVEPDNDGVRWIPASTPNFKVVIDENQMSWQQ